MSFFEILNTLIIGPIKLLFEIVFSFADVIFANPGFSIIFLSLTINVLILPLYMRADVMQKEAREKEQKLHDGIEHIKKVFNGDEKMMMLQTYYKQNDYSPFSAIQGSVSLLLQIPFFMAAVQVLSNIPDLNNASLGPISDLGAPDGLLVIGSMTFNLLPILMTVINFISSMLFSKGGSLKEKVQLYGLAAFFLIFLYNYPSGLVFYWLLNNVFSLVKTIFYKLKNPKKVLRIMLSAIGLALIVLVVTVSYTGITLSLRSTAFFAALAVVLQFPALISHISEKVKFGRKATGISSNGKAFTLGTLLLTVFMGFFIPSTLIAASPQEFVSINLYYNPVWYIVSASCLAAGTFLIWLRVFYWLANEKYKSIFEKIIWVLCGIAFVNYMFFGTKFGVISSVLKYEIYPYAETPIIHYIINLLILVAVCIVMRITFNKKYSSYVLITACIAMMGISVLNTTNINKSLSVLSEMATENKKDIKLKFSKDGKNVVVLMLDRAMGTYLPYILEEKPELAEQYSGFTNYRNALSFGAHTNFALPALMGGYEYTPVEMNRRNDESLASKHNEAHMVMPMLFSNNNFDVTVANPIYIDYQSVSDLAYFDQYPGVRAIRLSENFQDQKYMEFSIEKNKRNFFCYSIMKSSPLCLQPVIYNMGTYNQKIFQGEGSTLYAGQQVIDNNRATGCNGDFLTNYTVLDNLDNLTEISESGNNTFLFMTSNSTHNPTMLQRPEYQPAHEVDNTAFSNYYFNEKLGLMRMDSKSFIEHYHVNMASVIKLGEWFDYLKKEGIYDNTRIILVSDHGYYFNQFEDLIVNGELDMQGFIPLLMVKDFNATKFTVSDKFMTNADVPYLATSGLIDNPVNPFTNKKISNNEKNDHRQYAVFNADPEKLFDINRNNGNTFKPIKWFSIGKNVYDTDNIEIYDDTAVLTEYAFPQQ